MANVLAPAVYIKSVKLEGSKVHVRLLLKDTLSNGNFSWFDDPAITENFKIFVSLREERYAISLRELKEKYKNIKNEYFLNGEEYSFEYDVVFSRFKDGSLSAYTEYLAISSEVTIENVQYRQDLQQINKYKVVDELQLSNLPFSSSTVTTGQFLKGPFINYSTNKQAYIGFIFDIKQYLSNTSEAFRFFGSKYESEILSGSSIVLEKTFIEKQNTSLDNFSYERIKNNISIQKLSENKYLIGVLDNSELPDDKYIYNVRLNLSVKNYLSQFLNEAFIAKFQGYINALNNYKLEIALNTGKSRDPFKKYFEENYTASDFSELCSTVASIASFYNDNSREYYTNLLASCLHPLNTDLSILEKLIQFVNELYSLTLRYSDIEKTLSDNTSVLADNSLITTVTREYKKALDYNYDYATGFEVLVDLPLQERLNTSASLPVLLESELFVRNFNEANKYVDGYGEQNIKNLTTLSISNIDIKGLSYNLVQQNSISDPAVFTDSYTKANEYLNYNFSYRTPETYFFQIADSGVNIDTITNIANESVNNLKKSLLFDPNLDSKQKSLEYLTSTGLQKLYFLLNDEQLVIPVSSSVFQLQASSNSAQAQSKFVVTGSAISNPDYKAKGILYYNNLYSASLEEGSDYIDLYRMKSIERTTQLSSGFRHFNEYYLLKKAPVANTTTAIEQENTRLNAIATSILQTSGSIEEIGRTVKPQQVNIDLKEI